MNGTPSNTRKLRLRQKSAVFVAMTLFQFVLILIQLWLFVSVLENIMAGHAPMALPAAIISLVIALVNGWMLWGVYHMERSS